MWSGNSFFLTLILLPVKCGAGVWPNDQDATGPYALSVVVVLRANLKPEAPLSALLPTNNETERFLRGREHDQTGRCFIDIKHRKYSFRRRGEDPPRTILRIRLTAVLDTWKQSRYKIFRISGKMHNSWVTLPACVMTRRKEKKKKKKKNNVCRLKRRLSHDTCMKISNPDSNLKNGL